MKTNTLLALSKFASGKNLKALKADTDGAPVGPGSHLVSVAVTLTGRMAIAPDGEQTRRTLPSASDALEIALGKVNAATRAVIVQAVLDVQRGAVLTPAEERKALEQQWHADPSEASWAALERSREAAAMVESVKVEKTTARKGTAVFHGRIEVLELGIACEDIAQAEATTGLSVHTVTDDDYLGSKPTNASSWYMP